ncbi:MAG: TetR/AcrR family transcriptional regulator [Vicinamibacterales bacterium]
MSPRPSKVTDDDVFAAARRAMAHRGPRELTLAHIAGEAGVTAGRLVQRYGSKSDLLLALSAQFAGGAGLRFADLRRQARPPLAVLRAYVDGMASLAPTPEALARNLAYLQLDLADPRSRRHLVEHARSVRREIEALVREAVASGALSAACRPARLARAIDTAISGSLMTWACYQEGSARAWLRTDLDAVLAPYRVGRASRTAARR